MFSISQSVNWPENMTESMALVVSGTQHTHTHRKFENKTVVKGKLTVEFSGRMFQTVDSLLMVQEN